MSDVSSLKLACVIARVLDEKLGKDISILNISHVSSFADYFVICSGDVSTQVKALTSAVKLKIKDYFSILPLRSEQDLRNRCFWIMVKLLFIFSKKMNAKHTLLKNSGIMPSVFRRKNG